MRRREVHIDVSDHAVLRYLEREYGVDITAVKSHIAGLAKNAAELQAIAVQIGRVKLVCREPGHTVDGKPKVVVVTGSAAAILSGGAEMISRLVNLIGDEAALALVAARGGRPVYVPEHPTATCELAKIVGLDAATILGQEFGREAVTIPVAREWRILKYSEQGKSVPQIASLVGAHVDTVRKVRRKNGLSQAQMSFLDQL